MAKAVYVRVSIEEQALKGYSIGNQIEECKKKAKTDDVLIYADEGFTGEIIDRPALSRLREDARNGLITQVFVYDPDRLSRKLMVALILDDEFRSLGVEIIYVNGEYADNPEGRMFFSMRGAISEFEKAKIKERTSGGRRQKAKKGLVVKDGKLYGYVYNKQEHAYEINPNEEKFVKLIFDYYTDPNSPFKGINGIAQHLTDIGAPTKKGAKVWHRQVVRQILMNEAYTGVYYQNRWDTEGNYVLKQSGKKIESGKMRPQDEWLTTTIPSIITREQFEYAQELIGQGRRRSTQNGIHAYLLSGLVRCGRCGNTMTGRRRLSHGKPFFVYTCRKNYAGSKNEGCGRQMSENKLNGFVWEEILKLFNNPEKIKEFKDEAPKDYIVEEMNHLEAEIERMKKGRKRLFTLVSLSEDDLDLEEVKDQIRDLQNKEKDLQAKYTQLAEERKETLSKEPNQRILEQAIEVYVQKRDKDFDFEEKQTLLRMMVKEITIIDPDTVHIQLF